jgi:hypothetical protein
MVDGVNLYCYVRNTPNTAIDSTGRQTEDSKGTNIQTQPTENSMSKTEARREANKGADQVRKQQNMADPDVQAGHTRAARHAPESGISAKDMNDPESFQHLHSRKGRRLDVTVVDQQGQTKVTTRHRVQESMLDDAFNRAKATEGKITPEAHMESGDYVKWRTENVPMDQRDVEFVRGNIPHTTPSQSKTLQETATELAEMEKQAANLEKQTIKAGEEALEASTKTGAKTLGQKALKVVPFVGIGIGVYSMQSEWRQGNYGTAALEGIGLIPVVGDAVDAARLGWSIGEAIRIKAFGF